MRTLLIQLMLFSVFIYSPAYLGEIQLYALDLLLYILGLLALANVLIKSGARVNRHWFIAVGILGYYAIAVSLSGELHAPLYGVRQLSLLLSFVLFYEILDSTNLNIRKLFRNFFRSFLLFSVFYYVLIGSSGQADGFLIPRFELFNLKFSENFQIVGGSAILMGTFCVIAFLYFYICESGIESTFYKLSSIGLVVVSGTRASFMALVFGYLLVELQKGRRQAIKAVFMVGVLGLLGYILFFSMLQNRIEDEGSNLYRGALYESALVMFYEKPILGNGVNTFKSKKNQFAAFELPDDYDSHSELLKFMAEGGLIVTSAYVALWLSALALYKKTRLIFFKRQLYSFSSVALLVLMFHSLFDNFILAKNNQHLYMLFLAILLVIAKQNLRVNGEIR